MRLDLFSKEDSILLLGEGNFSFAVNLLKSKVANNITATCFEKEIIYDQQVENINYLKSENVNVLLDVDATKLHENEKLFEKYFSKIIFNFPHAGGKMKIHLNRELLKHFFMSASHLVTNNGKVIVSLCNGQGGIPLDKPQRRWDDSWQITEMAAHGNFVLVEVEPFCKINFPTYYCIGYRSQDVKFNLDGALVYIFEKRNHFYDTWADNLIESWSSACLRDFSHIFVPHIYAELYGINPLVNPESSVTYLKNLLIEHLHRHFPKCNIKFYSDKDVPVFVEKNFGVKCRVHSNDIDFKLRSSVFDELNIILKLKYFDVETDIIFFPGMYFLPYVGLDLFRKAPVKIKFLILGKSLKENIITYFQNLSRIFQEKTYNLETEEKQLNGEKIISENFKLQSELKIICKNEKTQKIIVLGKIYFIISFGKQFECCSINAAKLCDNFFKTKCWKEIWSEGNKVLTEFKKIPILKQPVLFPRTYKLDLTLRYEKEKNLEEEKVYQILWLVGGHIIENVEMLTQYTSNKGWSSKSFRITYKSLDKPLHRQRVINIQSKIICPLLQHTLKISIG